MHIDKMRRALTANYELLRNHDNYDEYLLLNDPTSTGVKAACLLNKVEHFHVTTTNAPDVMHDLLEGICELEVHIVLGNLIQAGFFILTL